MNFGSIKDIYAKFLINSYLVESKGGDKKKKSNYKIFIKNITENSILRTQFIVYKNIENGYFPSEVSAVEYLKENISLFDKFSKKDIIKENQKMGEKLVVTYKGYEVPGTKVPVYYYKTSKLHEAIDNLIVLEKTVENIDRIHESFEIVKKWMTTPRETVSETKKPKVDANKFLNSAVDKYNEKYSNLSEEDKNVIKTLMSNNKDEKETLLKNMVKESIVLINNALKEYGGSMDVKARLLEAKDVVYNLEFNEETYKEDISKIYDLKKSLS
jgi:ribosomal protein S20